ncbi:hypothetical protein ABB37_01880 [Leptomonas pyrrhocoris]|uniref:EF-hand domain-containing protein n=1 Tax=Leptomonas pyrrhocoris TaxID=157538 RepID=A0A0M9G6L0_LEPPY|nr:hypothetical protein ABB37_01880 [Leptomonas pyrrhocoris]XP_015662040.1 hypothetical protein ABB37_01880 [Leptomonas pyrrhocoris]KPA83600.1 hypothetical protein ABB37_01880 [Leptomonas pyrrhocoris]KPA83601.1 hypothetical protein ABB37_01880 [Leptomonas pyrrhocoris]|eukprot:XP_015662039.1 hypothetical protein ABB37_01880 [Leptomonas pyrrhocoris]
MRHSLTLASSPQPAKKLFVTDIVHKAAERLGRKLVWRVATHLEALPSPAPASAVRESLRDLSIFLSDEDFAAMAQAYAATGRTANHDGHDGAAHHTQRSSSDGTSPNSSSSSASAVNTAALLEDLCTLPLSPRRRYVLDLVLRKLDPNSTGVISYTTLSREYDVLRHPEVCSGARMEDDVLMEFFDNFAPEDGNCMEQLTTAELRMYAVGLSTAMTDDTEFELWCTRGFCLDRPKLQLGEETGWVVGSRQHSRQSRLLGESRKHPLFSTTYEEYGKDATRADYKRPANGRPQEFTKNVVVRTGGTTSMNM